MPAGASKTDAIPDAPGRPAWTEPLREVWTVELPKWVYVLRTMLAAFAALWIAFRLGFSSPSTSMITVFIVSVPQTGQVLAKSFYRTIGTLAGAAVAVLLVGTLVQERDLFVLLIAGWLGFCTTGAAYFRGFQAYAFVLSGYTASLVALPSLANPAAVFDVALFRVSEVMLGILCAGVFADLLFPIRVADQLVLSVRKAYSNFVDYLQRAHDGRLDLAEFEDSNLALVSRAIELETLRASGYFENPEVRVRNARLRLYNAEFMNVGTAFYGFYAMLGRRRRGGDFAVVGAFRGLGDPLLAALQPGGKPPANAAEARQVLRHLRHFRRHLPERIESMRAEVDEATRLAGLEFPDIRFDTVARQYDRFLEALTRYTEAYASLDQLGARVPHEVPAFSPHTETRAALVMGVRAFLSVLVTMSFWIASAWPAGAGAAIIAGVVCALFAAAPNATQAARNLLNGFFIGFAAAAVMSFMILPHLDGFAMLCCALAPVLMASLYALATPSVSGIGLGFNLMFLSLLGLTNVIEYDPVGLFNAGLAQIIGVIVGVLMMTAILPVQSSRFAARMRAQLRADAELACRAPLNGLRARFESRTRDVLVQLVSRADRSLHREQVAHALAVLDLGDAAIHLRRAARDAGERYPAARIQRLLDEVVHLLRRPSVEARRTALDAAEAAISEYPHIRDLPAKVGPGAGVHAVDDPLWRIATDLMRMRGILGDEPWFTELTRSLVPPAAVDASGEVPHAA